MLVVFNNCYLFFHSKTHSQGIVELVDIESGEWLVVGGDLAANEVGGKEKNNFGVWKN